MGSGGMSLDCNSVLCLIAVFVTLFRNVCCTNIDVSINDDKFF